MIAFSFCANRIIDELIAGVHPTHQLHSTADQQEEGSEDDEDPQDSCDTTATQKSAQETTISTACAAILRNPSIRFGADTTIIGCCSRSFCWWGRCGYQSWRRYQGCRRRLRGTGGLYGVLGGQLSQGLVLREQGRRKGNRGRIGNGGRFCLCGGRYSAAATASTTRGCCRGWRRDGRRR